MKKEEEYNLKTDKEIFFRLAQYAKPYIGKIVILFFLVLLVSLIHVCLPIITKNVIDNYIDRSYLRLILNEKSKQVTDNYKSYRVESDNDIFIPSNILTKDDYIRLQNEDIIFSEKFMLFEDEEDITLLKDYQLKGIQTVKGLFIPHEETVKISKETLKTLRKDDLNKIQLFALLYIGLLICSFFFNCLQVIMMAFVSERMMYDLRSHLIGHIMSLSMNFFTHNPVGRLVTRATNDVDALRELFSEVLIYSIKDIITIAGIFFVMFRLSVRLSLVMLVLIPVITIILFFFQKFAREAYSRVRVVLAKINSFLAESISGVSLIQIFNQEEKSWKDFKKTGFDYFRANMHQLLIFAIFRPLIDALSLITLGMLIYFGGKGALRGEFSIGLIIASITYIQMLFRPIFEFSEKFNIFQSAMASSERIFQLFAEDDKIDSNPIKNLKNPLKMNGRVEFKNVSFEYKKGEKVIDDVSFVIKPNESVAFVGATGAGKTTLINLLLRFYDPTEGEILIDGANSAQMDLNHLRNYFGLVLQDVFMFSGDIKYNILLNNEITETKMIEYAKYVNAHRFIGKLKDRYHHEVSEGGANLSTGQRQLIAFSRALAKEPRILVLDEATSSIDSETEYLIQDAIGKIMKDRTSIAIAHRLSTIQDVDRIYVMHKGKIIESGSHVQLLEKKGYYFELYKFQYLKA